MQLVKKKMMTCAETVIENSYGKRILLNEMRVPKGYNITDFDVTVCVRDSYSTERSFSASLSKTRSGNVADLTDNPMIVVPDSKLLTIKVTKSGAASESRIKMTLSYQHS